MARKASTTGKAGADRRELFGVRMAEWWLWALVFLAGIWATGRQEYGFGRTLSLVMDDTLRVILYKCCVIGLATVIAYRVDIKLMWNYRGDKRKQWLAKTAGECSVGGVPLFTANVALYGLAMACRVAIACGVLVAFSQAL